MTEFEIPPATPVQEANLPISAIVPTLDRSAALARALGSLALQGPLPMELIVIDGSADLATHDLLERYRLIWTSRSVIKWQAAAKLGAAAQRNQGVALATQPYIWFFDDDVVFQVGCLARLWRAVESDPGLGGVNAMITNQKYHPPGLVSRIVFALMNGKSETTYAGRVLGPAVNLLPEDRDELPEVVTVEWLNAGCTLYRREALPDPPFDSAFTGYSMMEDLALSLRVARGWKLANVRTARIFHDSQPGAYKSDPQALSCMELVNRHYVMTHILRRVGFLDYCKLWLWEAFQIVSAAKQGRLGAMFWRFLRGKWQALKTILGSNQNPSKHADAKD